MRKEAVTWAMPMRNGRAGWTVELIGAVDAGRRRGSASPPTEGEPGSDSLQPGGPVAEHSGEPEDFAVVGAALVFLKETLEVICVQVFTARASVQLVAAPGAKSVAKPLRERR